MMESMVRRLKQVALFGGYALALFLCAGGSALAFVLLLLPASRNRERMGRRLVYAVSLAHTKFLSVTGVVHSDLGRLAPLRERRGLIIAANHPTLLDAIMLFSELPQAFCVVKAEIMHNPLLAPLAKAAGFVSNELAAEIVDECETRLRRGETLIIFPEGTRTVEEPVNPFQPGFALLARRAGVEVQTVLIHSRREFLAKRVPFFNLGLEFPIRYGFEVGDRFDPATFRKAKEMSASVEKYFRLALAR